MNIQLGPISRMPEEERVLGVRDLLDFFFRRWKLIACTTAAVLGLVIVWLFYASPTYTASAEILLELPRETVLGDDRTTHQGGLGSEVVDSQLMVLRSRSLLKRVVEKEGLLDDIDPEDLSRKSWQSELKNWIAGLWAGAPNAAVEDTEAASPDDRMSALIDLLRDSTEASRMDTSNVIEVAVNSYDPGQAAWLANALAKAYVEDQLAVRHDEARRTSTWLNERKAILQRQLEESESAVERFKIDHNLVGTQDGSVTEQQLSELNLALIKARADTAEKRSRYEQVQRLLLEGQDVQGVPEVQESKTVSELKARRAEMVRTEADLLSKYGARHPEVTKVQTERLQIERQISEEIGRVIENLKNESEVAESREASLARSVQAASGQTGVDNQLAVEARELERVAAADRTLYEAFLAGARRAEEEATVAVAEARIISPAAVPSDPTYPPKKLFAALALVLGFGLGIAVAAIFELSRPGFIAKQEMEEALNLPVIASVPKIANWSGKRQSNPSRLVDDLTGQRLFRYNEAIESVGLGANAMRLFEKLSSVIQITSALPGEGKTVLATSLAVSSAAAGNRVLLIDADLRRSALTEIFKLKRQPGLGDILGFSADPAESVHFDEQSGVHVLPAGTQSGNPAVLLASGRMRVLLNKLRRAFDTIIIDTPPIAAAVDAEIISRLTGKVIFAVKWNDTARETVAHTIRTLTEKDVSLSLVLTMVDERRLPKYGRYGYPDPKTLANYYSDSALRSGREIA
jgi:capsular exopolysaccharide synthesis family protein